MVEDFANEALVQAFFDLKNKKVLLVSLNPELTEENYRIEPNVQLITNIMAKSINLAMNGNTDIDIPPSNIYKANIQDGLLEFLTESCEEPYLRLTMILYITLYENATDVLDIEGIKNTLETLDNYD